MILKMFIDKVKIHSEIFKDIYKLSKHINRESNKKIVSVFKDIFLWKYKYKSPLIEYYLFKLYDKSKEQCEEYIPSSYFCTKLALK